MTPGGGALGLALGRGFPSVFGSLLQYRSLAPSAPARVGFGLPQGWHLRFPLELASACHRASSLASSPSLSPPIGAFAQIFALRRSPRPLKSQIG